MSEIEVIDRSVFSARMGKGKGKDLYQRNVFEQRRIETTTAVEVAAGGSFTHKYDVDMFSQGFLINWPESYIKLGIVFACTDTTALIASDYVLHQAGLVASLSMVSININDKQFYIKTPAAYKMIRRMYETAQASERRKYFNGEYRLNHSMNTATAASNAKQINATGAALAYGDIATADHIHVPVTAVDVDPYQTFCNSIMTSITKQYFYIPFSDLSPVFEGDEASNHFFPLRKLQIGGTRLADVGNVMFPLTTEAADSTDADRYGGMSTYEMSFELTFYKPKASEFEAMSKKGKDFVYRFPRYVDWSSSPATCASTATAVANEAGLPVTSPVRMHCLQRYNGVANMTTVPKNSVPDVGGATFTVSCDGIKRPYTYEDYFKSATALKVYQEYLRNYYGSMGSESEAMPVISLNQFQNMGIYTIQLRDRLPFTGEDFETHSRDVRFNITQYADGTYDHIWDIIFETQAQMSFKWDGTSIPTDDWNLVG